MTDTPSTPPLPIDTLTCMQCGYLLRGLEGVARCPECGLEIDASLSDRELRTADPFWVGNLTDGAMTGAAAVALRMVTELLPLSEAFLGGTSTNSLTGASIACAWASSMLLTRQASSARKLAEPLNVRRALRIAATAHLLAQFILRELTWTWSPDRRQLIHWCVWISGLVWLPLYYLQLRRLGRRIPDAFIIRHSAVVMGFQIAAYVMLNVAPYLLSLLPRSTYRRAGYELIPGWILWWVASIYALILLTHARKRFAAAFVEANANLQSRLAASA